MSLEHFSLTRDLRICRLLNGMWQVSGAHGAIDREAALRAMSAYHDAGFTTWDLADHYGPAEDFVGEFRRRLAIVNGVEALAQTQFLTKWVPNPGPVTRFAVERAIGHSLRRMDVERIDLLQFHWWDYADTGYLEALSILTDLKERGLIRHLALTNFDAEHLRLVVERDIPIVSNQVQYSLIDRRPQVAMAALCEEHNIHLLAYGCLAGGFLSERYLGAPEPRRFELVTASLQKYKDMIDRWGGWALFQELLVALQVLAVRKGVSIANLGLRYVLDQPAVAGVIVGVRLGVAEHLAENERTFGLALDADDLIEVEAVLARGRDLFQLIGDCGDEYRR